jgi:hypothetical protein
MGMPSVSPTMPTDPNQDTDHDGYSPAQGDCDDSQPLVNPGAIEVPGDGIDNDCNGKIDDAPAPCDTMSSGKNDPASMAQSIELCDSRFLTSAALSGPSDARARLVEPSFGVVAPKAGANMVLISTGIAADKMSTNFVPPQPGTDLSDMGPNQANNPAPGLPAAMGCGTSQPAKVQDYTEYVVTLKAPTNANSFSFNFQFFSAEYPEFVCTQFNDEFLVMMESDKEYATPTNIAFDGNMDPITINNGFFTVCTNYTQKPQTQHCTTPVSAIAGTGYDGLDIDLKAGLIPMGGSTGWLTTTAPATPGETIKLHFIIFDEGDGSLDSAALIDNFKWGTQAVPAPTTIQ